MNIRLIAAILLLLMVTPVFSQLIFYPLNHKAPADIIPSIRPFLQSGETVAAGHNELILRIEPNNVTEVKQLIRRLDQPAHRLIIYVNRDGQFTEQTDGFNINNKVQIGVGTDVKSTYEGRVKIYSTKDSRNNKNNQTIQVLEGHTAHVSEGVSEPITDIQIQQYGNQRYLSSVTNYRDASKGFYVTPRLANGSVILEIAPWHEEPLSKNRTAANFTRTSSVIRGRLNTWIELAVIDENSNQISSEILGRRIQSNKKNNTIWVKVVDLDQELSRN